ncbi:MAG: hypothetical protein O2856_17105 [Planctomycetota bacterium]|nr:hypothetical protein [Planctomycetota bacterium]
MAIKFRCPHCQQLLGISTTKSGTIVDCPACGRSVNVPVEGGVATRTEQKLRSSDNPGFLDALQELSTLGAQNADVGGSPEIWKPVPRARKSPISKAPSMQADLNSSPDRDTMRIVPLANAHAATVAAKSPEEVLPELTDFQPIEGSTPLILADPPETDALAPDSYSGLPPTSPHDLTLALQELADVPHSTQSQVTQLQSTATQKTAAPRSSLWPLMLTLPAFATGLFLGTFWNSNSPNGTTHPAPRNTAAPASVIPAPEVGERQLKGVVRYVNDSGKSVPDSGAVVLLLPTENPTRLRLDARPLREPIDSKARQAIEVALKILGGSVHQVDDSGNWAANVPSETALMMIAISRHRSRTESQPVPAAVLESLDRWFESPLHIVGRLSVKKSVVSDDTGDDNANSMDIEFSR